MADRELMELEMADGTSVWIETDSTAAPAGGSTLRRVSRGGAAQGEADRRFEDAIAQIRPAAQALLDSLKELNTPEEIALEFGIKFNAKAGVVFASVDSEATFKVSLKWKNAGEPTG